MESFSVWRRAKATKSPSDSTSCKILCKAGSTSRTGHGPTHLGGPLQLVQGGLGVVGRMPIFLKDDQGNSTFWGLTYAVIRFPQALESARLSQLTDSGLNYILWRNHPDTGARQIIAASIQRLDDPVEHNLSLPNGTWTLSAAPRDGWGDPVGLTLKALLGLSFSVMLAYAAKLWVELKTTSGTRMQPSLSARQK